MLFKLAFTFTALLVNPYDKLQVRKSNNECPSAYTKLRNLALPTLQLQEVNKGSARQVVQSFSINNQYGSNEIYLLWSYAVAVLYRPIPCVTKRKTGSEWKSGCYAVILGSKEDRVTPMEHKYSEALCKLTVSMSHTCE